MPEPVRSETTVKTAHKKPAGSRYEVTSEGRVVVDVDALARSEAVQRIAKLAQEIADLSAQAKR